MNAGKTLLTGQWRKRFLIFLQRRQSLVSWQSGLIRWNDSFRKRLENIYLASMTHRIEIRRFPWDYVVILRFPVIFRNPLRSQTYGKYQIYGDKGIIAYGDNIRYYPDAVFQRSTNSIQGGIKYASYMRLTIDRQRREIFDPLQIRFLYTVPKTILKELTGIVYFSRTGRKPIFNRVTIRSVKPYQKKALRSVYGNMHLKHKGYKRKLTERTKMVSLSHTRRTLMVNQDAIRSMKTYKRAALKSAHRDLTYGDTLYDRVDSGMAGTSTPNPGEFSSSTDQINMDNSRNYFGGTKNLNPHEAPDTIGPFAHDGLKPLKQKHPPVDPFRHERVDSMQADTIYAMPPWTQAKTKSAGGRFNSILTSDITREFSRPLSFNAEREMPLYNIVRTEDPFWKKKETGKTGDSIDYNKVADRVYEILTKRIIREKERMGELI